MKKLSSQKTKSTESKIVELIESLKIPFSGTVIQSGDKKFHLSPFQQISISGIGPVFYRDKKTKKIYTLLQRRFKDNFQWWFPGGYVEVVPTHCESLNEGKIKIPAFEKIKNATIDEYYKNAISYGCWQKAKQEINDPKSLTKIFKKHKIKWPKEIDANWEAAWQREVLEETGVDLDDFPQKIILDFKFNRTLMIGAERDRLTNIDGKFCAFLGELSKAPKTTPDHETEELRWVALEEIFFDKKKKNYFAEEKKGLAKIVNLYTVTLIEEALFEVICHEIKRISKIKNPVTGQEISRFNTPQNLQSFLLSSAEYLENTGFNYPPLEGGLNCEAVRGGVKFGLESSPSSVHFVYRPSLKGRMISPRLPVTNNFLSWQFGPLEIGKDLCGEKGDSLFKLTLAICEFLTSSNLSSPADFAALDNLLKSKIK